MSSSDDCWNDAEGDIHGYAKYGYVRPTNIVGYQDNSNCSSWSKIQVDFSSREEVIRANFEWVLK